EWESDSRRPRTIGQTPSRVTGMFERDVPAPRTVLVSVSYAGLQGGGVCSPNEAEREYVGDRGELRHDANPDVAAVGRDNRLCRHGGSIRDDLDDRLVADGYNLANQDRVLLTAGGFELGDGLLDIGRFGR